MEGGALARGLEAREPISDASVKGDVVFPSARKKDFVSWGACLGDMEGAASRLLRNAVGVPSRN
jgi:hypothetical protein